MLEVQEVERTFPLADALAGRPRAGLVLRWLGQAGFVIDSPRHRLVIDAYLSDTLEEKYRHTGHPHVRRMPAPIAPADLTGVDWVLATHAHTDHLDPGTLPGLLAASPAAGLLVPAAGLDEAERRSGRPATRILAVDAGDRVELGPGLTVTATASAHESLEVDAGGRHRYLGYVLDLEGIRIWHSGDCVPWEGLAGLIAGLAPDLVLLPVNGRSAELAAAGFAGNFHLDEAVALALDAGASCLVAHHYGMFAFNTADPAEIDRRAVEAPIRLLRARLDRDLAVCRPPAEG